MKQMLRENNVYICFCILSLALTQNGHLSENVAVKCNLVLFNNVKATYFSYGTGFFYFS